MSVISFFETCQESRLLSPPGFLPEKQVIHYRTDPLTGVRCRFNERRASRPKQVPQESCIDQLARRPADCPFCPENIDTATPRFTADLCLQGYYQAGECRLFPNLFPLAPWHANISLTKQHFLSLEQFTAAMLGDAFDTAMPFIAGVQRLARTRFFPIVFWNHLPPSGSSIIHPHIQVLLDTSPTVFQKKLLDASQSFHRQTGRNYWSELIKVEKDNGRRFVGENASVAVVASYAPQGNREFQIVFKEAASVTGLDQTSRADLIEALLRLLKYYHSCGVQSFNMTMLSAALDDRLDYFSLSAKLMARPRVQPLYRNDTGILERVHYETDLEVAPEALASEARGFFNE